MSSSASRSIDEGVEVAFDEVESTLRSLWKQADEGEAAEGRPPTFRVTTLNLVVLTGTDDDEQAACAIAAELSLRHPGRVLIVRTEAKGPDAVRARVAMQCRVAGGGRQVCSEQVRLHAIGGSALRVAQIVAPLLVSDVPVMLWLPGHPLQVPVDDDLLSLVDRVIVDAHCFPDAGSCLGRLTAWRGGPSGVVDLAWLRLERWRSLTSQLFDGEEARADLQRVDRVCVSYLTGEGSPQGRVEALYYLAWLAGQLGSRWERGLHPDPAGDRFAARAPDRRVIELALAAHARPEQGIGDLAKVEISAAGGQSRYFIERLDQREMAEIRVETPRSGPVPAHVGLPPCDALTLLERAVGGRSLDPVFERVIAGVRRMIDAG